MLRWLNPRYVEDLLHKMVLPGVRRRGALRVRFLIFLLFSLLVIDRVKSTASSKIFYDRGTLLQLRETSHTGLFEPGVLNYYPELICYNGSTPGGCNNNNPRLRRRRGRRGGVARRLWCLVSKGRLTLPVMLFANVQSLRNKVDDLQARMST